MSSSPRNAPGTSRTGEIGSEFAPRHIPRDARGAAPHSERGASPSGPDVTIRQRLDAPAPGLPTPPAGESAARDGLTLKVHAPQAARLGETVRFEATIANLTGRGLTDVELTCDFDVGLAFPGGMEQSVAQTLGVLASGAVRTVPLSLELVEPGLHQARFTVSAAGLKPVTQTVSVQVLQATVELTLVGPTERRVGQRAEFVLTVLNRESRDLPATQVLIAYPLSLTAREASAGVMRGEGRLSWDLGTVSAQERVQIQVEFECVATATPAVIEVRLESLAAASVARSRLAIAPAQPLRLELNDSDDPVSVSDDFHYELNIHNTTAAPLTAWRLELVPSAEVDVGETTLVGSASSGPLAPVLAGGVWRLEGLPPLLPEASLSLRIEARAVREGTASLEVRLLGREGDPIGTREVTVINPPSADLNARRSQWHPK